MNSDRSSDFSAVDPALGYLYQVRSALLWTLKKLKADPEFLVGVETIDDVTFETTSGEPTDLLQTKHHRSRKGSVANASSDLWKTLRIWFEGAESGMISPQSNLFLITTSSASEGSAAWNLRPSSRNVSAAQDTLSTTAKTSLNKENAEAYKVYLDFTHSKRVELLDHVIVLDAAPTIIDLDEILRQEVYWAAGRKHLTAFLERLEGWWVRRVLCQLSSAPIDRIGSVELETQMSDLREQFQRQSLPIDDDLLNYSLDDATRDAHKDSIFVLQIVLTQAGNQRIATAIRDYYRAFEQRSRWLRDDLIVEMDLQKYERRIEEEWELMFNAIHDEVGENATAGVKEAAARRVLSWAEQTLIKIRLNVTEPFISRGSLHMLSDELRVGWHVDFRERLAHLLQKELEAI